MSRRRSTQKKRRSSFAPPESTGRNPGEQGGVQADDAAVMEVFHSEVQGLMEQVVGRENMVLAYKQVKRNAGAPGVDAMSIEGLLDWLRMHWPRVKAELLEGRYQPQPVRRVMIPKAGGKGMRQLGIPTVLDRLIQQALHQVLSPQFDPQFSDCSFGFRPGRSAQQAVLRARGYVAEGNRWVVDMDLEKFFDNVNHNMLMARVARVVKDKRVLGLIRSYLASGVMVDGMVQRQKEGTPQGGPLSPLLSNILLDDLDRELERRGHHFVRYADDCNIYVGSRQSGERVLASLTEFLKKKLKLKVNQDKSAVDRPWKRKFLGYSVTHDKKPKLKVSKANVKRLKAELKQMFRRGRGRNLSRFIKTELNPKLRGWITYFRYCDVRLIFEMLDGWIRRRLRLILWRQWKRPRTRAKKLTQRGLEKERAFRSAFNGRGPWWNSGASHMNTSFPTSYFDTMDLTNLHRTITAFQCAR